jgi:simple sugar transport system ATP-binding protein
MPVPARRLVELMFGEAKELSGRPAATVGAPVLEVRTTAGSGAGMTLAVSGGEVVGLAGLAGSGQRDLLRGCAGLTRWAAGSLRVGGTELAGRPYGEFVDAGVHLMPAGRLEEGLVPGLTIAEHIELCSGRTSFVVDRAAADAAARAVIAQYSIKGRPDSPVESLSGGNQQRLLLAMMPARLRLLLMEHPTRGLDLESAAWIGELLLERRSSGTGIVFASSDVDELLRYSDRVAVFFDGRIIGVVDARTTSPDELGHLIGGRVLSGGHVTTGSAS